FKDREWEDCSEHRHIGPSIGEVSQKRGLDIARRRELARSVLLVVAYQNSWPRLKIYVAALQKQSGAARGFQQDNLPARSIYDVVAQAGWIDHGGRGRGDRETRTEIASGYRIGPSTSRVAGDGQCRAAGCVLLQENLALIRHSGCVHRKGGRVRSDQ